MEEHLGGSARVGKWQFSFLNREEFFELKREIFGRHVYYVELEPTTPVIVDLGAHIGVSVGYFKQLYPKSTILAVEPNPVSVALLRQNVALNGWEDVEVWEAAVVGTAEKRARLFIDDSEDHWFMSGSLKAGAWNGRQQTSGILVKTVTLLDIMPPEVDLLKMDIEGAEEEVLVSLGARVRQIHHLLIEYHPRSENDLVKMLSFLAAHRFETTLWQKGKQVVPEKVEGLAMIEAVRRD
jgi:FkbM family methyltransferase